MLTPDRYVSFVHDWVLLPQDLRDEILHTLPPEAPLQWASMVESQFPGEGRDDGFN